MRKGVEKKGIRENRKIKRVYYEGTVNEGEGCRGRREGVRKQVMKRR